MKEVSLSKPNTNLKSMKTGFVFTILAIIASLSGTALAACSNTSLQTQAPNTPTTESSGKQNMMQGGGMNHAIAMMQDGMNHNMAMDLEPADANYDLRFIDGMTPHHQGAVEMAKEALSKSKRPEIKKLTQDIIAAQNIDINKLKQWRKAWYSKADSTPIAYSAQMGHMMPMPQQQMQDMMMKDDLGAAEEQFDLRFINAIIPHHEGAVTMTQNTLKKTKQPEIKKLCQAIITSQQKEIEQMKQWKQACDKQ